MRRSNQIRLYREQKSPNIRKVVTGGDFQVWDSPTPAAQNLWMRFANRSRRLGDWWIQRDEFPCCQIDLALTGKIWCEFNGERTTARPGEILLIPPVPRFRFGGNIGFHYGFELTGRLLRPLLENLHLDRVRVIAPRDSDAYQRRFLRLYRLQQERPEGGEARLSSLLYEFLTRLSEELGAPAPEHPQPLIEMLRLIHGNPAGPFSRAELARRGGCSVPTMIRLFHRYLGTTPTDYINRYRMDYARQLLTVGNFSSKEIAAQLEFRNQFYFSRVFKKYYGVAPSELRSAGAAPDGADPEN